MLSDRIESGNVSDKFLKDVRKGADLIMPVVADRFYNRGGRILTGATQQEIWDKHPEIVEQVRSISPRLAERLQNNWYERSLGLSLYFLPSPVISVVEHKNHDPFATTIHEIGHELDLSTKPHKSDDPTFVEAYQRDSVRAKASAAWARQNIKRFTGIGHTEEFLTQQLEGRSGQQETWANQFFHVVAGRPIERFFAANYTDTLPVVRAQIANLPAEPAPGVPSAGRNTLLAPREPKDPV